MDRCKLIVMIVTIFHCFSYVLFEQQLQPSREACCDLLNYIDLQALPHQQSFTMSSRQESTSLGDIMSVGDPSDGLRNRSELPNKKLEVRLQLTEILDSVLSSLKSDFQKDGMEVKEDANVSNAIVVSGFPPEGGYEKKDVLKKVKTHDDGAYIIPP